ncbi:MAG TPA: hypothetical protein VIL84_00075 [Devosiaceae bacterium]
MADLKIRMFKDLGGPPSTTVTIPGGVLRIAANLIPNRAAAKLEQEGINLDELVRLSENPDAQGTLVTIEDHEKGEQIVISLE